VLPDTSILPTCIGGAVEDGAFSWIAQLAVEEQNEAAAATATAGGRA
jgi:hypothetical protein